MLPKCCCLCVGLLWYVSVAFGDIDEDYYFGPALRSDVTDLEKCDQKISSVLCNLRCHDNHICLKGKCLCIDDFLMTSPAYKRKKKQMKITYNGYLDLTRLKALKQREDYTSRPSLRHHIAHFCPNLDDARVCIRACMKVGKPAFCGKDHKCYCGHKYTDPIKNGGELSEKELYAQFKDMYEKYFGPGYSPSHLE